MKEAVRKEKQAQTNSNFDSDSDAEIKRKIIKNKRYAESSDSDNHPVIKKRQLPKTQPKTDFSKPADVTSTYISLAKQKCDSKVNFINSKNSGTYNQSELNTQQKKENLSKNSKLKPILNENQIPKNNKKREESNVALETNEIQTDHTNILEKILFKQNTLEEKINNLEESMKRSFKTILTELLFLKTNASKFASTSNSSEIIMATTFPITSVNDFNELEANLIDEDFKNDLVIIIIVIFNAVK